MPTLPTLKDPNWLFPNPDISIPNFQPPNVPLWPIDLKLPFPGRRPVPTPKPPFVPPSLPRIPVETPEQWRLREWLEKQAYGDDNTKQAPTPDDPSPKWPKLPRLPKLPMWTLPIPFMWDFMLPGYWQNQPRYPRYES